MNATVPKRKRIKEKSSIATGNRLWIRRGPYRLLAAILIILFTNTAVAQAATCRVTTDGTDSGDGSDWNSQAMDLHTALSDTDCNEIWAAAGVYKPHISDRDISFTIGHTVQLYGGFEGVETEREQRDPSANHTILSGDLDDNDIGAADGVIWVVPDDGSNSENSLHVVVMDGTTPAGNIAHDTVLDGFIITAGNADGDLGGGLYCNGEGGDCSPTLANLIFSGNRALAGGAIFNKGLMGTSNPSLTNVTFSGNSASKGGAMFNSGVEGTSSPTLTNVTFSGNSAFSGGAMSNEAISGTSRPTLTNVTFSGNSAANEGGAMYNAGDTGADSRPTLTHVILWGNNANNAGPEIYNAGSNAVPEIAYSIVQGGCPAGSSCLNLIDSDPLLGPLADNGGFTPTMLPGDGSSAIDRVGNCPDTDQRGIARPHGPGCDIGSVEIVFDRVGACRVDADAPSPGDAMSWATAYPDLQRGLRDVSCTEIWVAAGVYKPHAGDRGLSFTIRPTLQLYGGFGGVETERGQRDPSANPTILSGDLGNNDTGAADGVVPVVPDDGSNSENSVHVVVMDGTTPAGNIGPETVLDGVIITAGYADDISSFPEGSGGGLLCNGEYGSECSPTLTNIIFSGNSTDAYGGAMVSNGYEGTSNPTLTNVTFSGNSTDTYGGAMANVAIKGTSNPTLTNVTFSNNTARLDGGGMFNEVNSYPTLTNVVFWNNQVDDATDTPSASIFNRNSTPTVAWSLVANCNPEGVWNPDCGGDDGNNLPDADPLFVDPDDGDYTLQPASPAINSGDPATDLSLFPGGPGNPVDLAGNPRVYDFANGGTIDMGAFELQGEPETPITLTIREGWRMLSNPIVGQSYETMLAPLWTQGVPGSNYEGDENTFPNVYTWNTGYAGDCISEYENGMECDGWLVPSSVDFGNPIPPGTGFLIYVFEDDNFDGTIEPDEPDKEEFDKTLTLSGVRHSGDVTPTINQIGEGWTLVGNPYGLPVAFSEVVNNTGTTGLTDVVYVYDPNASGVTDPGPVNGNGGAWRSTTAGEFGDLNGIIAPGQGFFVQTASGASSPSLTFSPDDRTTDGDFYGKEKELRDYVRLEVQGESLYNSAWIRFSEDGSLDQTAGEALELQPLSTHYAMMGARKSGGVLMDIAHYPLDEQDLEIPLAMDATQSGQFTIRATDLDLPAGMTLYLYDTKTGESMPIGEDFEYRFDLNVEEVAKKSPLERGRIPACGDAGVCPRPLVQSSGPSKTTTSGTDRFLITTTPDGPTSELPDEVALGQNYPNPFNPATVISYQLPAVSQVLLEIYDMLGRRVATLVDGQVAAGTHQVNFDASNLSSGVYLYRLETADVIFTKKLTLIK